jgi:hypothetical protein
VRLISLYLLICHRPCKQIGSLVRGNYVHNIVARFGLFLDTVTHGYEDWNDHLDQDVVQKVDIKKFYSDLEENWNMSCL